MTHFLHTLYYEAALLENEVTYADVFCQWTGETKVFCPKKLSAKLLIILFPFVKHDDSFETCEWSRKRGKKLRKLKLGPKLYFSWRLIKWDFANFSCKLRKWEFLSNFVKSYERSDYADTNWQFCLQLTKVNKIWNLSKDEISTCKNLLKFSSKKCRCYSTWAIK